MLSANARPVSPARFQWKKYAVTPKVYRTLGGFLLMHGHMRKFVEKWAGDKGIHAAAHMEIGAGLIRRSPDFQPVIGIADDQVAGVEAKGEAALATTAFAVQFHCDKGGVFNFDREFFDRRYQHMGTVFLASQYGGKQPDHFCPADRGALMIPCAVGGDSHLAVAAMLRVPLLDRGKPTFFYETRDIAERKCGEIRGGLHRHGRKIGNIGRLCNVSLEISK